MRRRNLEVQGEKSVRNAAADMCLDDRTKQAAIKEHYQPASNVGFDWT